MRLRFDHIALFSLAFYTVSFYLPHQANTVGLVLLGLMFALALYSKKLRFSVAKPLLSYVLLFVILAFGLLYTNDLGSGGRVLLKHAPMLLLPFFTQIILLFDRSMLSKLMNLFVAASAVASVICLVAATLHFFENGTVYSATQKDHFVYNHFMHQLLTKPIRLHAVYFALYLNVCGLWVINELVSRDYPRARKALLLIAFVLFAALIFLLKSAVFGILFPLSVSVLLAYSYRNKILGSNRLKGIMALLLVLGILFAGYVTKTKVEAFDFNFKFDDAHLSPLTMRLGLWQSAIDAIKEHWLLGFGTSNGMQVLEEVYREKGFEIALSEGFNAHNMYLQYWLTNGIAAFAAFLGIFVALFKSALKHKNLLLGFVLFLFACYSITESTMLRHHGLTFFVFITSIFYWSDKSNAVENTTSS
jgi:O-antigen ligase